MFSLLTPPSTELVRFTGVVSSVVELAALLEDVVGNVLLRSRFVGFGESRLLELSLEDADTDDLEDIKTTSFRFDVSADLSVAAVLLSVLLMVKEVAVFGLELLPASLLCEEGVVTVLSFNGTVFAEH